MADIVSKSTFADLCRVDASRVSHWIKDGKLTGNALVGRGRTARINVSIGMEQLRSTLDVSQSAGNGRRRLQAVGRPPRSRAPASPKPEVTLAHTTLILSELPANAAWVAAKPGVPIRDVFHAFWITRLGILAYFKTWDLEPPFKLEPVNWTDLMEETGVVEPVDVPAWESWSEQKVWGEE